MTSANDKPVDQQSVELIRRWRLILGSHVDATLSHGSENGSGLSQQDQQRDQALEYLYQREYRSRGINAAPGSHTMADGSSRHGGNQASHVTAPKWLSQVRRLFPKSSVEVLQRQALQRYGLKQLLSDPEVLAQATPSMELVRTLLTCRNYLPNEAMGEARRIIHQVIDELEQRLAKKIRNAVMGRRRLVKHQGLPNPARLDWAKTIRHNLKHFDVENDALVVEKLFYLRKQYDGPKIPWDIYILVDQSGSMLDSVIHSAVVAAIFSGLRCLRSHLIVFDTDVVDLSGKVDDPVEALLGIQLGGGTDIANAMRYTRECIHNPTRSLVVVISDFYEGASTKELLAVTQSMIDAGICLLGLAALDQHADPDYDRTMAQALADLGMHVGAMTPAQLAEWVGSVIA